MRWATDIRLIAMLSAGACALGASPAENPHWQASRCTVCHELVDNELKAIEPNRIDALCLDCHDGTRAVAEPHPIMRSTESPQIQIPPEWPLVDGRTSCITCHDVRLACDAPDKRPQTNSGFLRGPHFDAPRQTVSYCGQCHVDLVATVRHNPHETRDHYYGAKHDPCLHCHVSAPDVTDPNHRADPAPLRSDPKAICLTCHARHVDYFEPGHLGAKPSAKIRARCESAGLPLVDGCVTCVTCHNPHRRGTFSADDPRNRGSQVFGDASTRLPRRGYGAAICGVCHGS